MGTWRVVLAGLLMALSAVDGWASHIFGGDFSMTALPAQGRFLLVLNVHGDANTLQSGNNDPSVTVYIFRKSDHVRMASFVLPQQTNVSIVYQNEACAGSQGLKTVELRYSLEVNLNPSTYNDPAGYYVIWERCCRTDGVDNLQNRGQYVGMAFMFEFPPLMINGQYFRNSSPDFGTPNGDYICINKPFTMSMKATDADGDELRYSLVTPLQGYTSNMRTNGTGQSYTSYPEITWATGFGLANIIPGNRPLAVDSKSGQLTVTANQLGRFAFTVLVEEYRGGVKIGSVRRDFQLKVIDCSGAPPPAPLVYASNNTTVPAGTVEICEGTSVDLTFVGVMDVSYQWKKEGVNIPNEKSSTLKVNKTGEYQVSASFTKKCSADTISQLIKVVPGRKPNVRLNPSDTLRICNGDTARLQVLQGVAATYAWYKDGTLLPGETRSVLLSKQPGVFVVTVQDQSLCPFKDTVAVVFRPTPSKPPLSASKQLFCVRDSVKLETQTQAGFSIEWLRNNQKLASNQPILYTNQPGSYQVRLYSGSCFVFSDSVRLNQATANNLTFDSLTTVCYSDSLRIALKATPAGGQFKGNGVETDRINVQKAGVGRHVVQYELPIGAGCTVEKKRILEVLPLPAVELPNSVTQLKDATVLLKTKADRPTDYTYQWSPPLGLSSTTELQPVAGAPQTTVYTLTTTSDNGCTLKNSIRVIVINLLFIPEVFSPNNDGINDVWKISNVENFPEAEVMVYNRWGELIFRQAKGYHSPWDGTYKGNYVEPGEYTYVIKPNSEEGLDTQRGKVMVLH